jgi:hypothetical protein
MSSTISRRWRYGKIFEGFVQDGPAVKEWGSALFDALFGPGRGIEVSWEEVFEEHGSEVGGEFEVGATTEGGRDRESLWVGGET